MKASLSSPGTTIPGIGTRNPGAAQCILSLFACIALGQQLDVSAFQLSVLLGLDESSQSAATLTHAGVV